ncbi:MAG: TetR/AcrR family transcriptional regulator [Myxococcales bacterium]|nr:TetR/AcrR family transcriptional regulator [Myxococcales bacterium]
MQAARDPLRPTRQRRSQRSLERILEALDSLIEEKTFEEITVSEVCTRAGVAVGTFYDRVGKKDALLEHLRQRVYAEMLGKIDKAFAPERFAGLDLAEMLTINAHEMVALHRRRQGAIRAMVVEARRSAAFAAHAKQFNALLHARVTRAWLDKREQFGRGDPERLAHHAFLFAVGFLREAVIWEELWPDPSQGEEDQSVAASLATTLTCFLTQCCSEH